MNTKTARATKRMTRKEFFAESDRLLEEARGFLDDARRNMEETKAIGERNERIIKDLRAKLLCGRN
jgi:hypothetical protein